MLKIGYQSIMVQEYMMYDRLRCQVCALQIRSVQPPEEHHYENENKNKFDVFHDKAKLLFPCRLLAWDFSII